MDEIDNLIDYLFSNAIGDVADRLVLTSADGRDLGGWCRRAVRDAVEYHLARLLKQVEALGAFKAWVHAYLDAQGVPHHPPGPHGAEGCRIGDRMDWLMARLRAAEAEAGRVLRLLDTCRDDWQGAIEERDAALDSVEELGAEVAALRKQVEGHCDRIARQSELLTRKAEGNPGG